MKEAQLILIFFTTLDLLCFMFYGIDKRAAIKNKQRIPEKVLLGLTLLGGSFGAILSMLIFSHKTKKKKFFVPVIIISIVHRILFLYILFR